MATGVTYYDSNSNRLVFTGRSATASYWDGLWASISDFEHLVARGASDPLVRSITKKYLPPIRDTLILEGGCGIGQHVAGLQQLGYTSIGVDYARETVARIQKTFPELQVAQADIRSLPFTDKYFDGYWSLGVIEHFQDGYEKVTQEMARVIKPGGYLFITFPHLSLLRRMKIWLNIYPHTNTKEIAGDSFYQFGLDENAVVKDLEKLGFFLVKKKKINGLKGLKDEVRAAQPVLQWLYDCSYTAIKIVKVLLSAMLTPFTSHTILLVLRKSR